MSSEDELSCVIDLVYAAAIDASRWPKALEAACNYIQVRTSNLIWRDSLTPAAAVFFSHNFDPEFQRRYFEVYAGLDPHYPASILVPVGQVFTGSDIVPHEELRKTRFYKEWVEPQRYAEPLIVNIERSAAATSSWVALRGVEQGPLDPATKQRFAQLAPHVVRAVTIGRSLEFRATQAATLLSVIDNVASPVFLLCDGARFAHANPAAQRLLEPGGPVRNSGGHLTTSNPSLAAAFEQAVTSAAGPELRSSSLALMADGRTECLAQFLPLATAERRIEAIGQAKVAVFVREIRNADPSALQVVGQTYRLTPSELRVLSMVADSASVADLAARLGIAVSTAKTHLRNLYAKTGTRRQADLVRILSRYGWLGSS